MQSESQWAEKSPFSRAGQDKGKKWKQELTRMTEVTPTGRGVGWTGSKPQEEDLMWPVELWPGYWWPQCHRGEEGLCSLAEICPRVQLSHSCGWNFLSSTGYLGICDLRRFCLAPPVHLNSTGRMNKCSVVDGYEIWSTAAEKKVSEATHACIKVIISSGCRVCLFPLGPYPISSFLLPHGAIRLKERLPHHLKVKVKVAQSCLTLWNPMNCIGWILAWILQARILQW